MAKNQSVVSLRQLRSEAKQILRHESISSPGLEADWIIESATGYSTQEVVVRGEELASQEHIKLIKDACNRRSKGEPLAYILGKKGFRFIEVEVGPGVLIPRPETECIVDFVLAWFKRNRISLKKPIRIADLGAGSGAIGLALYIELVSRLIESGLVSTTIGESFGDLPLARLPTNTANQVIVDFYENSELAFAYLVRNTSRLGGQTCKPLLCDALEICGPYDLIVGNPPYIARSDLGRMDRWVLEHEPSVALFSEQNGLQHIKDWLRTSIPHLSDTGLLAFEIGDRQAEAAMKLAHEAIAADTTNKSDTIARIENDLSGTPRFIVIERSH